MKLKTLILAGAILAGVIVAVLIFINKPSDKLSETEVMPSDKFPEAEITNDIIDAKLYLPDNEKGYYRGTRFDHAGNIPSLKVNGHEYFGQWFDKYDPQMHDAIMGPAEVFAELGFIEAKPGETFVKVGVGTLTRPDDKPYSFARLYPVVDPGKWTVRKESDHVEFIHELNSSNYSYVYTKTVRLVPGKAEMELVHSLKNTGVKTIETSVYNHNFFVMDNLNVGPDYTITFPWNINLLGSNDGLDTLADITGNRITFLKELRQGENVFYSIGGFSDSHTDHDIRIENRKAGVGVRITCDRPLLRLAFWSCWKSPCPEAYVMVKAEPGQEFSWTTRYEFYNL
ncbi:MAG: hypothetical protein LBV26_03840 [Bacteroidales bacterium]|jgi:hypothetical protein|nr:hypothetical protein [Bacteroidales bacterium]